MLLRVVDGNVVVERVEVGVVIVAVLLLVMEEDVSLDVAVLLVIRDGSPRERWCSPLHTVTSCW